MKNNSRSGGWLPSSFLLTQPRWYGVALGVFAASAVFAAEPPQDLSTVIITAPRKTLSPFDTAASLDVIDGADMRDGKLQVNLSEALGGVAGLQIRDRQNYAQDLQLSIRGFGARSSFGVRGLRLYVDGIPATMPDGQGQTSNVDITSAESVEILRGPFSALYGNSSGGVIRITSKEGRAPAMVSASVAAGSFGTYRYGVQASGITTPEWSGIDYLLSASRFTTEGNRDHSAARKNLENAKFGWHPDDSSKLTFILNSVDLTAQDALGLTRQQYEAAPRSAPLADQYNTRKTVSQTQGGLIYERRIDADNALYAMAYSGQRSTQQFQAIPPSAQLSPTSAGGVIDLDRDYDGADLRWTHRSSLAGAPLTLSAGIAYDEMFEHRRGYNNYTGSAASNAASQLGQLGALRRDEDNTVRNFDQYLQAHWDVAQNWALDAGVRHSVVQFFSRDHYVTATNGDDSGTVRYQKMLPAASLLYRASPDLNLYVSAGRGFETPTFNELAYKPGNAPGLNFGLLASPSTSTEAGAKLKLAQGLLTAALFQTTTDNEIVTDTSTGGRATYRNAGRTLRQGVELGWAGSLANDWQGRVAYTLLDAIYRDRICTPAPCSAASPASSVIAAGARLPGVARQSLFGSLAWTPPQGWRASLEGRYVSSVSVDDANSDAAPAFFTASASTGYLWIKDRWTMNAYARIDNLFDRQYAGSVIVNESNGRFFEPAPGRNGSAGLSIAYAFR
ncbi:TonB-dependent receptor family protein [Undibacterium sp.]|uniref:TonB-dependent receptor family protein n=1 Tax=Undibacterium sp. TaxID=1914977 RepID=UPI00374D57F8